MHVIESSLEVGFPPFGRPIVMNPARIMHGETCRSLNLRVVHDLYIQVDNRSNIAIFHLIDSWKLIYRILVENL